MWLKGAVCRIDTQRLNYVLQSKFKILETVFFTNPSSSDLTHAQDARLTTPTGTSAHDDEWNEMRGVFRQLATRGAEIQLGKLAVGGFHKP